MAESAVSFLVEKLASLLQEEVKLLTGFRGEVRSVRDEFERMSAFLRAADHAAEDDDEEIKVWVKQVRELAYDTEDLIDEFLYVFEERRRRGFYGYLCKIARTIKNLKARRRMANEMKDIRSKVTDISEGRQRYRYKLEAIQKGSSSTAPRSNTCYELRNDARLLDEAQLVGLDKPKQHLLNFLVKDAVSGLRVVAVVGMGGLGKTTLVSKVYDGLEVKMHFQNRAWVTVSQSVKLDDILRQIIQQLFDDIKLPLPDEVARSTDNLSLKKIIVDFLRGKRYLIVLDDIWSVDAWDAIKVVFPDNNNGSRLMITTRISKVASSSTKELGGSIYPLMPLSFEESWTLFCAKTFQGNSCPPYLETISQNILKRCEGLPLAIVAIGGMLATKENRIDEWEMVNRCLRAEIEGNTKLKNMQEILLLSFNDLPYNLKHCFMYLSIFPEDYLIKRNVLIRLWIAEGFLPEIEGRAPEEVGQGYFNELLNRSLIQVGDRYGDYRIRSCRVHDFLREIILLKSKDQNFAAITNEENKRLPERVRRLSMHEGKMTDEYGGSDFSRLRSLLLFGVESESVSSNLLCSFFDYGLRLLKVMDFSGALLSTFPEDITKLYHLRYLSLRNTDIKSIPRSIGKLRHLETLDLKNTFVEELPTEILQLQCLRHLIVYRYGNRSIGRGPGFKAFEGMETLSSLRKLCSVEANRGGANFLVSIGRLTQLTRLDILQLEAEHEHAVCSSIGKLSHLRSVSLESRTEDDILDLQFTSSSPPLSLQRLYVRGRLDMLPHWLLKLTNLTTLAFAYSRLQVDPLESLQALPNLVALRFETRAYDGEALCFKAGGFPRLRYFRLNQANNLRRVTVKDGALPHLEELLLEDCKLLKEIPSGVERLRNLQRLGLVDMAEDLIKTIYRGSRHENYLKVMHVPFVHNGYGVRFF